MKTVGWQNWEKLFSMGTYCCKTVLKSEKSFWRKATWRKTTIFILSESSNQKRSFFHIQVISEFWIRSCAFLNKVFFILYSGNKSKFKIVKRKLKKVRNYILWDQWYTKKRARHNNLLNHSKVNYFWVVKLSSFITEYRE